MSWATEDDLLVGDISTRNINVAAYIDAAVDEIHSHVGRFYELPLPVLTGHQLTVMKTIHARLASGRLIMAQAAGREELHNYGKYMVDQAYEQLYMIGTSIALTATTVSVSTEGRNPAIVHPEPTRASPFDVYEQFVHGGNNTDYVKWT